MNSWDFRCSLNFQLAIDIELMGYWAQFDFVLANDIGTEEMEFWAHFWCTLILPYVLN